MQDARKPPLDAIRRPRNTPIWKLEAALKCRMPNAPLLTACSDDQAHRTAGAVALRLGASECGQVRRALVHPLGRVFLAAGCWGGSPI
jgi:hypothetical protein